MSDQTPITKYLAHLKTCESHRRSGSTWSKEGGETVRMLSCTCGLDAAIAAHVEAQRPGKVLSDPEDVARLAEKIRDLSQGYSSTSMGHRYDGAKDAIKHLRDNGYLAPAQPLDPDAHITDRDAYLKAKQERAKNTDFDGIEAARVDPAASHMEHCRTLVGAQPDETLADAIERLMASQKSLSVDKIMEVVKQHKRAMAKSPLDPPFERDTEADLRERLNKLIG